MLRNAGRTSSRTLANSRHLNHAHISDYAVILLQSSTGTSGVLGRKSLNRHALYATTWMGYRSYATSGAKGVKQLSKDEQSMPPTLRSSSTSSSTGSSSSTKKHVEPRLTPRKAETTILGKQGAVQTQGQLAKSTTATSTASSISMGEKDSSSSSLSSQSKAIDLKDRIMKPHLMRPIDLDNVGIIKTALNDIDDALSNGTLQPLPADLAARSKATHNIGGFTFDADTGRVWWHKLKEMTKFYFFGITKLGREHRIIASDVRRRLKESEAKGFNGVSEWRDREFLNTYKMDLLRLVPFVSIIVILEEILPLVIIYAPFLLPSTCKLPSQARRIEDLGDKKRWDALISLGQVLRLGDGSSSAARLGEGAPLLGHEQGTAEGRLDRLPEGSIQLLCRMLGITPYGPSPYLKFRLRSTLASLSTEDTHFASPKSTSASDPISQLSLGELRTVLGRRGFPNTPLSLPQLRQNLQWWLAYPEHPTEKRLGAVLELARYSSNEGVFPSRPPGAKQ